MASLRDIVSYPRRLRRAPPDAARGATLSDRELAEVVQAMRVCASGSGGDARALASAAALKASYERLSHGGRRQFLVIAATELGLDRDRLAETARTMLEATGDDRRTFEDALRAALESPWSRLLRQVNRLPGGTRFLVDVRADLLRLGRRHPVLRALEQDLRSLLQTWFDVGFLELRRVTWDSSASLLERLARSEAVHTVVGWDDLKNRLDTDRRLYACFHPHMPDDPLSFVEVALARGLPREIGPLLDQHAPTVDPGAADTAVSTRSRAWRGAWGASRSAAS